MAVRAEELRALGAQGAITKRGAFGGAGDDSDMLGHDGKPGLWLPGLAMPRNKDPVQ
jgi:hypothetical protein